MPRRRTTVPSHGGFPVPVCIGAKSGVVQHSPSLQKTDFSPLLEYDLGPADSRSPARATAKPRNHDAYYSNFIPSRFKSKAYSGLETSAVPYTWEIQATYARRRTCTPPCNEA